MIKFCDKINILGGKGQTGIQVKLIGNKRVNILYITKSRLWYQRSISELVKISSEDRSRFKSKSKEKLEF